MEELFLQAGSDQHKQERGSQLDMEEKRARGMDETKHWVYWSPGVERDI